MSVTLNADLGESWYDRRVGNDAGLMPYLDLCNLACGFHGGDTLTQYRTIELAAGHHVAIGAHPSFPDRKNFGRRPMAVGDRLYSLLLYQVGALAALVRAVTGGELHHLKPHGALYHFANEDAPTARQLIRVMTELGVPRLIGPPTGALRSEATAAGLTFLAEGFVDRVYEPTLHLRSRQLPDACIEDLEGACTQAALLASAGRVIARDGQSLPLRVATLCIHGDHPGAVARAYAVRKVLDATAGSAIPPR